VFCFKNKSRLIPFISAKRQLGNIGFVPTMGALHDGHISLINRAKQECKFVVCSIFVNPTQFNNKDDFEKYPVTTEADIEKLMNAGCDVLYMPDYDDIYDEPTRKISPPDYGRLLDLYESEKRPGHFNGVIDVVSRLFDIVKPEKVFFGQKDYQQCLIIKKLIALSFNNITFYMCPSVREPDGLALSSRNIRLNNQERAAAAMLYQMLKKIADALNKQSAEAIKEATVILHQNKLICIEYLAVCDAATLLPLKTVNKGAVVIIAAFVGSTRLIDNIILSN